MAKLSGKRKNIKKSGQHLNFYNDSLNASAIKKGILCNNAPDTRAFWAVVGLLKTGFPRAFQPCRPPP